MVLPVCHHALVACAPWRTGLLNGVLITGRSNSSGKRCPVVAFASGQHGPDVSCQFIRNRSNHHTVGSAPDQSSDPVRVCSPSDDGARAIRQQGTQIGIAALGYSQLPYSSSCACLPRHQPQPSSKFSPRLGACRIHIVATAAVAVINPTPGISEIIWQVGVSASARLSRPSISAISLSRLCTRAHCSRSVSIKIPGNCLSRVAMTVGNDLSKAR
jgi:hypothetical protein